MSSAIDYVRCAEMHSRLVAALAHASAHEDFVDDDFSGWTVTAIYYSACLLMKAYSRTQGKAHRSHQEVRDFIHDRNELDRVRKDYLYLENESRQARYEGQTFTLSEIKADILPSFGIVYECLKALLAKQGISVPPIEPARDLA